VRGHKQVDKVGRYTVENGRGACPVCEKCGEVVLSLDQLARYQRNAAALVLREAKNIDGAVIKYARKALGLTQTRLAGLLGIASETLSRWETDAAEMPRTTQLALVAVLDGVELAGGDVDKFIRQEEGRTSVRHLEAHASVPRVGCG
jgi:DNA-binding transcriptional regulator YiaG